MISICEESDKRDKLKELLQSIHQENENPGKILIFAQTKRGVDNVAHFIQRFGVKCASIHGDKSQTDRDMTLNAFRSGRIHILVASDVAARGLDVDGINYVINYDYPNTSEDYIHRIGRTGRAAAVGTAHTFFTENDVAKARDLVTVLLEAKQEVPTDLMEMANRSGFANKKPYGGRSNNGGGAFNNNGGRSYNSSRNNDYRKSYNSRSRYNDDDDDDF